MADIFGGLASIKDDICGPWTSQRVSAFMDDENRSASPLAGPLAAHRVSLGLGVIALILVLMFPSLRAADAELLNRIGLALLLVGGISSLAHGMDTTPRLRHLRFVMRPSIAWPATVIGGLLAWLA
jgi:hypothetical protein